MIASASMKSLANCAMVLVCIRPSNAHLDWQSQPTCEAASSCTQSLRTAACDFEASACLSGQCTVSGVLPVTCRPISFECYLRYVSWSAEAFSGSRSNATFLTRRSRAIEICDMSSSKWSLPQKHHWPVLRLS